MPHERAADTRGQLRVNGPRLLHRIATLATIGATADGGVTRAGFSDADREGIHWVMSEAREAGLRTWVDPAGNMFAEFAESPSTADSRPVLLLGSHLDSVVNGGRLDGAYGVLAGLEVLQTLAEYATELPVRPRVVAFANEEGAEVPIPFFGSLAAAGRLLPEWTDVLQRRAPQLREPLRLVGGDLDRLAEAELDVDGVAGYLELHIEQGIGLESKEVTVGIVDAIVGKILWEVDIRGTQSHAGTTPMSSRSDATLAAADLVRSVHHLGVHHCQVATVGRIETPGGVPNTVCSSARISVDVRDPDQERLDAVETLFKERLQSADCEHSTRSSAEVVARVRPAPTDARLREAVTAAAEQIGLSNRVLSSGAGHDAQVIADILPIGMIFVPSRDGVSHAPGEHTDASDLVQGADVLLRTVLEHR